MAIKYISIVLGTIFEIYCINMFTNIYLPRKEIEKYKYYLIFIFKFLLFISMYFAKSIRLIPLLYMSSFKK